MTFATIAARLRRAGLVLALGNRASAGLPPPAAMPMPVQARQPVSGLPWASRISKYSVRSVWRANRFGPRQTR